MEVADEGRHGKKWIKVDGEVGKGKAFARKATSWVTDYKASMKLFGLKWKSSLKKAQTLTWSIIFFQVKLFTVLIFLYLCPFHFLLSILLHHFPLVVNCTEPGHVDNSVRQVLPSGPHRYSFQTSVSYRCNPGYYLLGTSSISCQGDGTWDRSLPKCLCKYRRAWLEIFLVAQFFFFQCKATLINETEQLSFFEGRVAHC